MSEQKGLGLRVECEECKHQFSVSKENTIFNEMHEIENKRIYLTYYDCPECGKRYFVQIDDAKSLEKLKKCKRIMTSLMVLRAKDKAIPKKQSEDFKKNRKHLAEIRNQLMKDYDEVLITDPQTGKGHILKFSVLER